MEGVLEDRSVSQLTTRLFSAIAGVFEVITTHQDVIWKAEVQDHTRGRTHSWKISIPVYNAGGQVNYQEYDILQCADKPPWDCKTEPLVASAKTIGRLLSLYKLTIEDYWDEVRQSNDHKNFFRLLHRGFLSDQRVMRTFLPCGLKYATIPLCSCGSTRGEEICTGNGEFVRWPIFGIAPTDRTKFVKLLTVLGHRAPLR